MGSRPETRRSECLQEDELIAWEDALQEDAERMANLHSEANWENEWRMEQWYGEALREDEEWTISKYERLERLAKLQAIVAFFEANPQLPIPWEHQRIEEYLHDKDDLVKWVKALPGKKTKNSNDSY